jgi:hypothetical protein
MSEGFEWNRIHKWEENIEMTVTDSVFGFIEEFYGVEDVSELNEDQFSEVLYFREHVLYEYSVMQAGFSNFVSYWEGENEEV